MSVKKTQKKDSIVLNFKGINASIVNAIRRTCKIDIPAWSINKIDVETNTSPLIDEYIMNRIRLIPLNNEELQNIDDKDGLGTFTLDVKAKDDGVNNVYSHDIKGKYAKYILPNQIIAKLKGKSPDKFEELKIKMSAEKGTHKDHVSFDSSTAIEYDLDEEKGECQIVINENGTYKGTTIYGLTIDILIEKLEKCRDKMEFTNIADDFVKIHVDKEDDTLGQLIQTYIMDNYKDVSFISANKPHPLEDHIIIEMKTKKDHKKIIDETVAGLIKIFKKLK